MKQYKNGQPMPTPEQIAKRLDSIGLDHCQVASALNVNPSSIGHWRAGRREIQFTSALALFGPFERLEQTPDWE